MRSPAIRLGIALSAAGALAAASRGQDTPLRRFQAAVFALDLPTTWRPLNPTEALQLGDTLPIDMQDVRPGRSYVLGDVDRWLAEGFDGRSLLVLIRRFETPVREEELDQIRRFWSDWRGPDGSRREVLEGRISTVGPDAHPAHQLEMRFLPGDGGTGQPALRTRDYYASTMGQQLILSFRAWENDWDKTEPTIRRMAASLTFAQPPREPDELGDRLFNAVLVGAVVGLGLLVLRMFTRRTPQTRS